MKEPSGLVRLVLVQLERLGELGLAREVLLREAKVDERQLRDPDALKPSTEARAARSGIGPTALTAREQEILEMIAEGMSNRIIANRLGISSQTVKFHVASILAKLGAGSRTEAVTFGLRQGLIAL